MLLRLRQERQSEPAPPEPPPAPALTPELTPVSDAPEVSAPPTAAALPPAIPLTPKPEARCSHESKGLQNEPAAQRLRRRFRSRKERKIYNAASLKAARC